MNEIEKSPITVRSLKNYDPPVAYIQVSEEPLRRGYYIPELGIVDNLWDDSEGTIKPIEEAIPRQEAYIVQTRVTEEQFPLLPKNLQKFMLEQNEKRLGRLKELYEKWKDVENVTVENLYEDVTNYQKHLGLGPRPDPRNDPVRLAYAPPANPGPSS